MPNQDALTLAKVAIEAQKRYCEVYVPSHYREHGLFGKSGVLISPEDFIAAAIDRHMVQEGEIKGQQSDGGDWDFYDLRPMRCGLKVTQEDEQIAPLYRITQEPKEREDGD